MRVLNYNKQVIFKKMYGYQRGIIVENSLKLEVFKTLIDNATDGYMIADGDANILYTNDAYINIVSIEKEIMVGHNIREYIERGEIKRSSLLTAIEQRKEISITTVIREQRVVFVTSTPIFDEKGNISKVLTLAKDYTEYERMKRELKNVEMFLDRAHRFEDTYFEYGKKIIAVSDEIKNVFELARRVLNVDTNVIILGESGVGKDVVAKYIHENGTRKNGPYIAINCSAIPEQLLESELFGYAEGSFTGATKGGKKGIFEAARGGILFLDEIGDISLNLQVKLLRAIENRTIKRVGDHTAIPINVRIITATNKNLEEMVLNKQFREDLYYRLKVISIYVPPLKERKEDILPLINFYLEQYNRIYSLDKKFSSNSIEYLIKYNWPGNIRELKNVIERLIITSNNEIIREDELGLIQKANENEENIIEVKKIMRLRDAIEGIERKLLTMAKKEYKTSRAISKVLGIDHTTVSRKIKKYRI